MKTSNYRIILFLGAMAAATNCKEKKPEKPKWVNPEVLDNGEKIFFPEGAAGRERIKTSKFGVGKEFIQIQAPARVLASISTSVSGGRIVLFESPELNTTYASYVRARNQYHRSSKNLGRIRDMYKLEVATEKDTIEAEAEAGNSHAEVAEAEAKLRAVGFNPRDLGRSQGSVVWVIADISESKLDTTKRGKKVKLIFNSFPDVDYHGTIEAIGDNIDPATRTVKVRIVLPNKKSLLKPGMFAQAQFADDHRAGLVLPFTSIFTVEAESFAFIETEANTFVRKKIVIGNSNADYVEILEGLKKGDTVVTEGVMLLKGLSVGY